MLGFVSIRPAVRPFDLGAQVVEVEVAASVGLDLLQLVTRHRDAGRVRPVRRVGRDHRVALLAAVGEVSAHQHQAGELSLRSRRRLERARVQARDLGEDLLQAPHQLEGALRRLGILKRVQVAEAGMRDHSLVDARVVLHRAGAERVEARVDSERARRELGEVAHELGLGHLGQPRRLLAAKLVGEVGSRQVVVARQGGGAAPGL